MLLKTARLHKSKSVAGLVLSLGLASAAARPRDNTDRKSTRLNSSHMSISYAVFCLTPRQPISTLFPYTTLFRSIPFNKPNPFTFQARTAIRDRPFNLRRVYHAAQNCAIAQKQISGRIGVVSGPGVGRRQAQRQHRSEEHTSELQSHVNLVCRLLLDTAPTDLYTLSLHDALPIYTFQQTESIYISGPHGN